MSNDIVDPLDDSLINIITEKISELSIDTKEEHVIHNSDSFSLREEKIFKKTLSLHLFYGTSLEFKIEKPFSVGNFNPSNYVFEFYLKNREFVFDEKSKFVIRDTTLLYNKTIDLFINQLKESLYKDGCENQIDMFGNVSENIFILTHKKDSGLKLHIDLDLYLNVKQDSKLSLDETLRDESIERSFKGDPKVHFLNQLRNDLNEYNKSLVIKEML